MCPLNSIHTLIPVLRLICSPWTVGNMNLNVALTYWPNKGTYKCICIIIYIFQHHVLMQFAEDGPAVTMLNKAKFFSNSHSFEMPSRCIYYLPPKSTVRRNVTLPLQETVNKGINLKALSEVKTVCKLYWWLSYLL